MTGIVLEKLFDFSSWGPRQYIAQVFGLLALLSYIISYQQKKTQILRWLQLSGSICWCLDFLFLGAPAGVLLNAVGIIRGIIYLFKEKHAWARHYCWYIIFITAFIGCGVAAYFMGEGWLAIFPSLALVLTTISLSLESPLKIRIFAIITCPLWVIYELINLNIMGLLNELISLTSAIVGIIRIDILGKKKSSKTE